MQGTTRCRWSSKSIELFISIVKHDDSDIKLNHTGDRPVDQKGVIIIIMQQIYFCTGQREVILSENPQVRHLWGLEMDFFDKWA